MGLCMPCLLNTSLFHCTREFEIRAAFPFSLHADANQGPDMGLENILAAVRELMKADAAGEKVILHCSFGNNRSRTVAEAFHFKRMGFQLEDEYKGYSNHLAYTCGEGHLPPLEEMERILSEV